MHHPENFDLGRQRSILEILRSSVSLYRNYPLPLLILAFAVIAPYDVAVLAVMERGPFGHDGKSFALFSPFDALGISLLAPLIAALYVHAVLSISEKGHLPLRSVALGGLRVLPVVIVAELMASLGIAVGYLFFIVPGIILALRWSVVAQVAALETGGGLSALRRSGQLTAGHYWHIFGLTVTVGGLASVVAVGVNAIVPESASIGTVALEIASETIITSAGALILAILYFDLRARYGTLATS